VNDGRGNRFDLLDIDGCAIDPIIMPDVKYEASLQKASVETWGFKFSDTSVLNFQCVVELCKKAQGECNGLTPPSCGRGKRSVDNQALKPMHKRTEMGEGFDLVSTVDVIDNLEPEGDNLAAPQFLNHLNQPTAGYRSDGWDGSSIGRLCLSTSAFVLLLSLFCVLFVTALITTVLLCHRLKSSRKG